LTALKESMIMSQEAGDNLCLQQAAGWAQRVDGASTRILPPSRISRPTAPCARHRAALAAQAYVQHAVSRKITPSNLFTVCLIGYVNYSFMVIIYSFISVFDERGCSTLPAFND